MRTQSKIVITVSTRYLSSLQKALKPRLAGRVPHAVVAQSDGQRGIQMVDETRLIARHYRLSCATSSAILDIAV
jgi:hypothetical protein